MASVIIGPIHSSWKLSEDEQAIVVACSSARESYTKLKYNRSHRFGSWDGTVQFFNANSKKLPSGLVPDAIDALKLAGFSVDVCYEDHRDFSDRPEAKINFDITADHQVRSLEAMCTHKRGILHAATNSGKTKIAEAWCALNDFKILYLVPTKELLRQTVASFKKSTNLRIGQISAEEGWEIGDDVTVCLVTSVVKRKSKKTGRVVNQKAVDKFKTIAKSFEAIIVDECHHMQAEGWRWVLRCCTNAHYRYGLSGTPWNDKEELSELRVKMFLGPVIAKVTNSELIEKGWSATPIINMVPIISPQIFFEEKNEDDEIIFKEIQDPGIVYNDLRNSVIGKLCQMFYELNQTCLVVVERIAQCEIISSMLELLNVPHRIVTGSSSKEDRRADLEDFRRAEFPILISTVLSEGVDIPALNGLIFAAGGKSSKLLLQRIGRGVRKKREGENVVKIYDFIDNCHSILKSHTNARIKLYRSEGFEVIEKAVTF